MLPKIDGLEVCREIRKQAMSQLSYGDCERLELIKFLGLGTWADDYVSKNLSQNRELTYVWKQTYVVNN